jgi:hypothetical protein
LDEGLTVFNLDERKCLMAISPLAGKPAPTEMLVNLSRLEREYYERWPDLSDLNQQVRFGTSGHRGSSLHGTFTEAHILAITQAICDYRQSPEDGGFKYNPTNGGPADTDVTKWVENRANELLRASNTGVKRVPFVTASRATTTHQEDFVLPYVNDLRNVVDMEVIRGAGLKLAVDPLGGAAVHYWGPINEIYGLNIKVVNPVVNPTFSFMMVDHDGRIRMECSSPYAMARLVSLKDRYRPPRGTRAIGAPSAGLSLDGLRSRRAHLRFTRHFQATAAVSESQGVWGRKTGQRCSEGSPFFGLDNGVHLRWS